VTEQHPPMSEESIREYLAQQGARVMSRSGRNDHYGSPRDFSFEVKAVFANGLGLHIIARQYNYRDPWEADGRINDLVDLLLLHNGRGSELPKGYAYFQGSDCEEGVDFQLFTDIVKTVESINPKLFILQSMTGDL